MLGITVTKSIVYLIIFPLHFPALHYYMYMSYLPAFFSQKESCIIQLRGRHLSFKTQHIFDS